MNKLLPLYTLVPFLFFSCATTPSNVQTAEETAFTSSAEEAKVKSDVLQILKATKNQEALNIKSYTHPYAIQQIEKIGSFAEVTEKAFALMTLSDSKILSYSVLETPKFYQTSAGNKYTVVKSRLEMVTSGVNVESIGHMVGQYIPGSGWKYIQGQQLAGRKIRNAFPDFPKGAEFPVDQISRL